MTIPSGAASELKTSGILNPDDAGATYDVRLLYGEDDKPFRAYDVRATSCREAVERFANSLDGTLHPLELRFEVWHNGGWEKWVATRPPVPQFAAVRIRGEPSKADAGGPPIEPVPPCPKCGTTDCVRWGVRKAVGTLGCSRCAIGFTPDGIIQEFKR